MTSNLKEGDNVNAQETYYQQHHRCPVCGEGSSITCSLAGILPRPGQQIQDRNQATCRDCGWKGTVHDLRPEGLTVEEVLAREPAAPAGPQLEEEEPITIDDQIEGLKRQEQALGVARSAARLAEYRQLVREYMRLLADRMRSLDLGATRIALQIARQIKATEGRTPEDDLLAALRILCGTKHAVPETLAPLYIAFHCGKQEEGNPEP
jgi:hypothetical protein